MTKTTRKAIRQRKICMLLIIILIIVLSVLGGGYYLLSQKNASSPENGGQNSDSRNQTDLSQNSDIVEYKGCLLYTSTIAAPSYHCRINYCSDRRCADQDIIIIFSDFL